MRKTWNGPTPYFRSEIETHMESMAVLSLQEGYRAAMNSPEVKAMYEKLHELWLGDHWQDPLLAEALAAYEAGL